MFQLEPTPQGLHSGMKPMKLDLPKFASDDPLSWLAIAGKFLTYHKVPGHMKVAVAAMHLTGDAALWMSSFESRF